MCLCQFSTSLKSLCKFLYRHKQLVDESATESRQEYGKWQSIEGPQFAENQSPESVQFCFFECKALNNEKFPSLNSILHAAEVRTLILMLTMVILNKTGNVRTAERLVAYRRGTRFVYFTGG